MSKDKHEGWAGGPPVILAADIVAYEHSKARLVNDGWTVQEGFDLASLPWDVRTAQLACAGSLDDAAEAEAAILAAARGAALILLDTPSALTYLDDLLHVGDLHWSSSNSPRATVAGIAADQRRVLALLAAGRTVNQAARECHMSLRTAQRRLVIARGLLGVATNRAAVVELARRESGHSS